MISRTKIIAAKLGISVSGLVARELEALVAADDRYQESWGRARELMAGATPRGGRTWHLDEIHERSAP